MTLGALFVILAIILKRLAVMVPFLGFPSLKITLEVLPLTDQDMPIDVVKEVLDF